MITDLGDGTIKILATRYQDLLEKERWLHALQAAGVDNWQGYEEAAEIFNEDEDL